MIAAAVTAARHATAGHRRLMPPAYPPAYPQPTLMALGRSCGQPTTPTTMPPPSRRHRSRPPRIAVVIAAAVTAARHATAGRRRLTPPAYPPAYPQPTLMALGRSRSPHTTGLGLAAANGARSSAPRRLPRPLAHRHRTPMRCAAARARVRAAADPAYPQSACDLMRRGQFLARGASLES